MMTPSTGSGRGVPGRFRRSLRFALPSLLLLACAAPTGAPPSPPAESTGQDAEPIVGGVDLKTELFPEIARQLKTAGGTAYSPEACTANTATTIAEMVTVPAPDLATLYAAVNVPSPCPATGACTKTVHVNTLSAGRDLQMTTGSVAGENPGSANGIATFDLATANQDEIVVAKNITFDGEITLARDHTYVFVATEGITFGTYTEKDEFGTPTTVNAHFTNTAYAPDTASGGVKITRKNNGVYWETTVSGAAKNGANGQAGARVILITPKVTGPVYANLAGQDGALAESLPDIECDSTEEPYDGFWCANLGRGDYDCYKNAGEGLKAGKGGNGGHGGALVVVTDSAPAVSATLTGGQGGAGGVAASRGWGECQSAAFCSWWGARGDVCLKSDPLSKLYGTAGAAGTDGAAGAKPKVVKLNGKIRDFAYWLGSRVARRDMLNGRYYALATDPDQTGGNANRTLATGHYQEVVDTFCEATLPTVTSTPPHALLPKNEMRARVATCAEAKAQLAPLSQGLDYFGMRYDAPVYADPDQLKALRDAYYTNFKSDYRAPFQAAVAAAEDPVFGLYGLAKADAQATSAAVTAERALAESERDRAVAAAKIAAQGMNANVAAMDEQSDALYKLQDQLQSAVQPKPEKMAMWRQFFAPWNDIGAIGKTIVKVVVDILEIVVEENYAETAALVDDFKKMVDTTKNAEGLWGTWAQTDPPLDTPKAGDLLDAKKLGATRDQICQAHPFAIASGFVALEKARLEIDGSGAHDPDTAKATIEAMKHVLGNVEQLSRETCGLFDQMALAGRDASIAEQRVDVALLKERQSKELAQMAADLAADVTARKGRLDWQRDVACRQAKRWEEAVLFYDFLSARAEQYATFSEPATDAAKGDFRWRLLGGDATTNAKDDKAYDTEIVTGGLSFAGWSAASAVSGDYRLTDDDCAPGGPETTDRCETERATLGQLLDTGLVHLRLEEGPSRFGVSTERALGRVTSAAASLVGPATADVAARLSHAAKVAYVGSNGATTTYAWSTSASRDLCELLESRNNALRAQVGGLPASLGCGDVPDHFTVGAGVVTPDLLVWKGRATTWPEANDMWNAFGASARGEWTADFRATYREQNRLDFCYSPLHDGQATPAAATCIGDAFLPANCRALREQSKSDPSVEGALAQCLADALPSRVSSFAAQCAPSLAAAGSTYTLTGDPPADCDRACGLRCQALKASISGLRVDLNVRSHGG